MRPSSLFVAGLCAAFMVACASPLACPDGRVPDGEACACANGADDLAGVCVPGHGAERADDAPIQVGVRPMRDGGAELSDLDAALEVAQTRLSDACFPGGGCSDASAAPDAGPS